MIPPEDAEIDERGKGVPLRWSRAVFGMSCLLCYALMGIVVASAWDGILDRLTRSPVPTSSSLASGRSVPAFSAAEGALAEARRRLDAGQPAAALRALDAVKVGDPEYPFASQLRSHAFRMVGAAPVAAVGRP